MTTDDELAAGFDREFGRPASAVMARVWGTVLGEEYPAELAPYSWTTRTELAEVAREVKVASGDLLVDVGSGRGGPGLWVAARTGADHLAVDVTEAGLEAVRETAGRLGVGGRSRTALGSFEDLPLDDGAADAVMSVDALLFSPDKAAAARELARVTRPGGAVLASVYASVADNGVRDVVDGVAARHGFEAPAWHQELRAHRAPQVGTAEDLVRYRFGQAQYTPWFAAMPPGHAAEVRAAAVAAARPVMTPYRPRVLLLVARVP